MSVVDRKALLEAAERRDKALRLKTPSRVLYLSHDEEHDIRQDFRRRVDYIISANKPVQAFDSLKVCKQNSFVDWGLRKFRLADSVATRPKHSTESRGAQVSKIQDHEH